MLTTSTAHLAFYLAFAGLPLATAAAFLKVFGENLPTKLCYLRQIIGNLSLALASLIMTFGPVPGPITLVLFKGAMWISLVLAVIFAGFLTRDQFATESGA